MIVGRDELHERLLDCLRSVQVHYVLEILQLNVEVSVPVTRFMVPLGNGDLKRSTVPAAEVDANLKIIRVHPQLAQLNAPRYVLLNLVYSACRKFLVEHRGLCEERFRKLPLPASAKADAWLVRYGFPSIQ